MMNKQAAIMASVREFLAGRVDTTITLTRPQANIANVSVGGWAKEYIFSDFNDDGDTATEAEHDTIYSALETIVSEHNA